MVWYEGGGTSSPRFLHADERGSIVAVSDNAGGVTDINTYDTWGVPAPDNAGRFQYTGQIWLPQLSLYQYKARMYAPHIGRFMQTDPIGYDDGMNMYSYVGNDPVNAVDPLGLNECKDRAFCSSVSFGYSFSSRQQDALRALGGRQSGIRGPLTFMEPGSEGGAGPSSSGLPGAVGARYEGPAFGYGPTIGRRVPEHYPTGRIVSGGRLDGLDVYSAALRDADRIASLNGIERLGELDFQVPAVPYIVDFHVPVPIGSGWIVRQTRDYHIASHVSGLELRTSPHQGRAILDIPGGFRIPNSVLIYRESVHYPGR